MSMASVQGRGGVPDQHSGALSGEPLRALRMLFSSTETQTSHERMRMWFGGCWRSPPLWTTSFLGLKQTPPPPGPRHSGVSPARLLL